VWPSRHSSVVRGSFCSCLADDERSEGSRVVRLRSSRWWWEVGQGCNASTTATHDAIERCSPAAVLLLLLLLLLLFLFPCCWSWTPLVLALPVEARDTSHLKFFWAIHRLAHPGNAPPFPSSSLPTPLSVLLAFDLFLTCGPAKPCPCPALPCPSTRNVGGFGNSGSVVHRFAGPTLATLGSLSLPWLASRLPGGCSSACVLSAAAGPSLLCPAFGTSSRPRFAPPLI